MLNRLKELWFETQKRRETISYRVLIGVVLYHNTSLTQLECGELVGLNGNTIAMQYRKQGFIKPQNLKFTSGKRSITESPQVIIVSEPNSITYTLFFSIDYKLFLEKSTKFVNYENKIFKEIPLEWNESLTMGELPFTFGQMLWKYGYVKDKAKYSSVKYFKQKKNNQRELYG